MPGEEHRAFEVSCLAPCSLWALAGVGRGSPGEVQKSLPSDIAPPPPQNFCSRAALEALGSCLNNKYSEGYPGKR